MGAQPLGSRNSRDRAGCVLRSFAAAGAGLSHGGSGGGGGCALPWAPQLWGSRNASPSFLTCGETGNEAGKGL